LQPRLNKIQYVHKSQLNNIKKCSRQFLYKDIYKLKPEFVNESSLTGSAFHRFAEEIYLSDKQDKWDDWKYWVQFWANDFQKRKEQCVADGIDVGTSEDIKSEDFVEMIVEFLKQPYNRFAEPVLIEAKFRFYIKVGKKKYWFEGTIDQLLKIEVKYLQGFPFIGKPNKDYVYIHRDIKTGNRRSMSEIGLTTDDNINVYSYALRYGLFDLKHDNSYSVFVSHIPFAHAIYYTRDHLKYKKNTGKNEDGSYVHKPGDYKGQAMYFVKKSQEDLKMMEPELVSLHNKINSGIYTRDGAANNLCDRFCGFKKVCLHDWRTNG